MELNVLRKKYSIVNLGGNMKILTEIFEKDLVISNNKIDKNIKYKIRKASRGVVINNSGKIAILDVSKENHYKLPGGGVEKGETISLALRREISEEVGVRIKIIKELGIVKQYRNEYKELQVDYGYLTKVKGKIQEPSFDEGEMIAGFKLCWMSLNQAIKIIEKQKPKDSLFKFITARDLIFLQKAEKIINEK